MLVITPAEIVGVAIKPLFVSLDNKIVVAAAV
jgi:hypothetical protein